MGLNALLLRRGAGVLGASLPVTCVTGGFGLGNCSASGRLPTLHSGGAGPQKQGCAGSRWQDMASLAVAAALSVDYPDLSSICPLSRLQLLWVWPEAGESLVLLVLKIIVRITGSEEWCGTSPGILLRNRNKNRGGWQFGK